MTYVCRCPENVKFSPLSTKHLDEIYSSWVTNGGYTFEDLKMWYELDKKYAIGIFCKITGALLSRCLLSYAGWISVLQTVESVRGKGYAKLLLKKVSKMMAEDSVEPLIYTRDGNETAWAVIRGTNFKHTHDFFTLVCKQ